MRKLLSPSLQKEYWIGDHTSQVFQNIPVFSEKEIQEFKEKGYTPEQFLLAYNLRLELAAVESIEVEKESVQEDLGYTRKEIGKDFSTPRYKLAEKYAKQIADEIRYKSIKGVK